MSGPCGPGWPCRSRPRGSASGSRPTPASPKTGRAWSAPGPTRAERARRQPGRGRCKTPLLRHRDRREAGARLRRNRLPLQAVGGRDEPFFEHGRHPFYRPESDGNQFVPNHFFLGREPLGPVLGPRGLCEFPHVPDRRPRGRRHVGPGSPPAGLIFPTSSPCTEMETPARSGSTA